MDAGKAIFWTGVALVGSTMVGYGFGFWEARPAMNATAIVGALAVVIAAVAVAAMIRAFLRSRSLQLSLNHMSMGVRIGLVWGGVAIVACINIGAFLGFITGLRTAQSVMDILSGVGVVAMIVASTAVLIAVVYSRRFRYRWGRRE